MAICCENTLFLGCANNCELFDTGLTVDQTGIFTVTYYFLGSVNSILQDGVSGETLKINPTVFNEFDKTVFNIFNPDGSLFTHVVDEVEYECFSLTVTNTYGNYSGTAPVNPGCECIDFWIELSDTPSSYSGATGYLVRVNATLDGLEFVDGNLLYMAASQQLAQTKSLVAGEFLTAYDSATGLFTSAAGGSAIPPYVVKSVNYTVLATDSTIDNDTPGVTTTLLTAVGITGQIFNITNSSGGTITVNTTSSQTIYMPGGATTNVTLNDGEGVTVQSTGTNWRSL